MSKLEEIKRHVDRHGVGCVIVGEHVAISIVWTSKTIDGRIRRMETISRARSLAEACSIIGCPCPDEAVDDQQREDGAVKNIDARRAA